MVIRVVLTAMCVTASLGSGAPDQDTLIAQYINMGAVSPGGAPNCTAWEELFAPNVTTLCPVTQSGTGVMDVTSPRLACSKLGRYAHMQSYLTGTPIVERFSATFTRVAFSWTFAANQAGGAGGPAVSVPAISTLWLSRIPGPDGMAMHIDTPFEGPGAGTHGAADYFSSWLG